MATIPRITWSVCSVAAVITLLLGGTSKAGWTTDVLAVAFVLGPYLLLGLLALGHRGKPISSRILLAVAFALAVSGVCLFGLDSYRYLTDPQHRMAQRMAALFVPIPQWAAVLLVGLGLLGYQAISPLNRSESVG
jgi:FtsH-binding integral membrane protein